MSLLGFPSEDGNSDVCVNASMHTIAHPTELCHGTGVVLWLLERKYSIWRGCSIEKQPPDIFCHPGCAVFSFFFDIFILVLFYTLFANCNSWGVLHFIRYLQSLLCIVFYSLFALPAVYCTLFVICNPCCVFTFTSLFSTPPLFLDFNCFMPSP